MESLNEDGTSVLNQNLQERIHGLERIVGAHKTQGIVFAGCQLPEWVIVSFTRKFKSRLNLMRFVLFIVYFACVMMARIALVKADDDRYWRYHERERKHWHEHYYRHGYWYHGYWYPGGWLVYPPDYEEVPE